MNQAMSDLLDEYKTKSKIARTFGVSKQVVGLWYKNGYIPFRAAQVIEKMTKGIFKAIDLVESDIDPTENLARLQKRGVQKVD